MYYYYYQICYNDQFRDKLICRIATTKPATCIQRQTQQTVQKQWKTIKQTYGVQSQQEQKFRKTTHLILLTSRLLFKRDFKSTQRPQIDPASVVT